MRKKILRLLVLFSLFTLTGCKNKEVSVTSISIKENTFKNLYQKDQQVNLEGFILIVNYDNESYQELQYPSIGVNVSHFSTDTLGEKNVIITYREQSIEVKINVVESIPIYLMNKKIEKLNVDELTLNDKDYVFSIIDDYDALKSEEQRKIINFEKVTEAYYKILELDLLNYKDGKKNSLMNIIGELEGDYTFLINEGFSYIDGAKTKSAVDWYYNNILAFLNGEDYEPYIYVKKIDILNSDIHISSDGTKYVVLNYTEGMVYQLEWRVYPYDAINPDIEFLYDSNSDVASVDSDGCITFYKKGAVTIYLQSIDGSDIIEPILIMAK